MKTTLDCQLQFPILSSGLWLSNNPVEAMVPLLMLEIILIVAISNSLHFFLLRRFHQPVLVSQILTGIVLGPGVMGRIQNFSHEMFPRHSIRMVPLKTFSMISNSMFFLMVGVKTDPSIIWRSGKKALVIGIASNLIPMMMAEVLKREFNIVFPYDSKEGSTIDSVILAWSYSSFVVISDLLGELKLLNSKVGRLAISTTLVSEVLGLITMQCFKSVVIGRNSGNRWRGFGSLVSSVALATTAFFIARPLVMWGLRRTPTGKLLNEAYLMLLVTFCLTFGLVSEVVGNTLEVGMFVLGLALPSGPPLGTTLAEKLGPIILQLGIPTFVAIGGIRSNFALIGQKDASYAVVGLLAFIHLLKFACISTSIFFFDITLRDAMVLALIMSYKGIFEIGSLNTILDYDLARRPTYSLMILYILIQAVILAPTIKTLCDPSLHYKTDDKRRTIQHANYNLELKILTSIYGQEEVSLLLDLLDSIHTTRTCLCIYALHLVELTGQAASILVPYNNKHKDPSYAATSSTIFNAFRYLESRKQGFMSVHPFTSVSPNSSMHGDICTLAMDKKVSMVILPFHKTRAIDGTLEYTANEHRSINANVLHYAPCSIGILVNNGGQVINSVVVYYIGGPDDREAVSVAMLMVGNPRIRVSIVRFLPPKEWRNEYEDKLDEEHLEELGCEDLTVYREEHVRDAEEMIDMMCSMSTEFDLLIVGRQEGHGSYLTQGLSNWNDYTELGIIGDILTPMDLRSRASILVVQQHKGAS